jgi:hypothetical protein
MILKRFVFPALLVAATLAACGPPPPVAYPGEAEVVVETQPPVAQVEVRPAVPWAGAVWVEGHWYWRGNWEWIPGHWDRPRVGWVWVPHHWSPVGRHWRYVPGHWARA